MNGESCPSSSSESSSETDEECPNKPFSAKKAEKMAKVSSDPALYEISPRLMREMQVPCDNYKAAMCCRMHTRTREPIGLESFNSVMKRVIGQKNYDQFITEGERAFKPGQDTLLMRRIMEMLDLKNKVLLQQSELPKVFNKVVMSHAASKFQGALEAAEKEMVGIHDLGDAEVAATIGVHKFNTQTNEVTEAQPRPKITIVGYIGCYNDKEDTTPNCKAETKSASK